MQLSVGLFREMHHFIPGDKVVEHFAVGVTEDRVLSCHDRGCRGSRGQNKRVVLGVFRTGERSDRTTLNNLQVTLHNVQVIVSLAAAYLHDLAFTQFHKTHHVNELRDTFFR